MWYVRYPLSLRNVEDQLHERGIDITHGSVRFWWNRFGTIFAADIRKKPRSVHATFPTTTLASRRNVREDQRSEALSAACGGHEGEVLESFVTKTRDRKVALKLLRKSLRRHGRVDEIVTDRLASYGAAMRMLGNTARRKCGRYLNNCVENSRQPIRRRERAMSHFRQMRSL